MPTHLHADPRDVAPVAVLVGDPARAPRAAAMLDGAREYTAYRGLLGYTGEFEGHRVSVQTTGMGGPSAAIVVEELHQLGVRTVIRAGTCGAFGDTVAVLDFVVATAAVPLDGTSRQYLGGDPFAPVADFDLTARLLAEAGATGRTTHAGLIVSQDAFYEEANEWAKWRARGVLAVEMEASTIFTVALLRGMRAACVCLAVNDTSRPGTWVTDDARGDAEAAMLRAALRAAVSG